MIVLKRFNVATNEATTVVELPTRNLGLSVDLKELHSAIATDLNAKEVDLFIFRFPYDHQKAPEGCIGQYGVQSVDGDQPTNIWAYVVIVE